MYRIPLTESQHSLMTNALVLAADKYRENAEYFRKLKPVLEKVEKENPERMALVHSSICDGMAEQFDKQARETGDLIELVSEAEEA